MVERISTYQLRQLRQKAAKEGRLDKAVVDAIAELHEDDRLYVFRPETRCRVCTNDASASVNKMLAHAMTYADIERSLEPINNLLPKDQRITYQSISTHAKKHFPIEQAASAVYRKLVEKRAEEYEVDFTNGVGSALVPMAYLDVVMHRGFETLVDENTVVDVETGMRAAEQLQQISAKNADENDMADLMLKLHRIVEAVKAVVPEEMFEDILSHMDGQASAPLDVEMVDEEIIGGGYDPGDPDNIDTDPDAGDDRGHF